LATLRNEGFILNKTWFATLANGFWELYSNKIDLRKSNKVGAFQNYAATPLFWRGQGEVIINA
jgi:hypothetical protein